MEGAGQASGDSPEICLSFKMAASCLVANDVCQDGMIIAMRNPLDPWTRTTLKILTWLKWTLGWDTAPRLWVLVGPMNIQLARSGTLS